MATNADRRRAIGAANEKARRGLGQANEASRRALGDAMVERRTGQSQVDDINAVVRPATQRRTLPRTTSSCASWRRSSAEVIVDLARALRDLAPFLAFLLQLVEQPQHRCALLDAPI